MRKTPEKKLVLSKVKVAKLSISSLEKGDGKAPTYTGCSLFMKCTPPISKDPCF
ncbi:hypothetical protein CLV51_102853 [Chitinophaga niastensis]|uniref:Uncharacterized protein n=1 Tax=Chitinophaga niastensis TaxID=536980 RepID=A0A2P8HP47_CHINA|nr:hypothetical protein [Chitinophaga niastensis]PSL47993.1 hypothetical protein CLV51_102853 [Chitinophaga niastensis]